MAFVVEDGTGLVNATSGASVEEADEYFTDRGITAWTGADSVKESALIRATDYVEIRWGYRFKYEIEFPDTPQALSFPRLDDDGVTTGVPVVYKKALFEYALRALDGTELAPDPTVVETGLGVIAESHKTGPVTDSYRYASKGQGSTPMVFRPYPAADQLLRPLLKAREGLIR